MEKAQPTEEGQPFFEEGVAAGFPSPAEGEKHNMLDLNGLCVRHPLATYYVRARGDSMAGAGIEDGDILVVDRSLRAASGDVIIASLGGGFTVKRLEIRDRKARLLPENPAYAPIDITPEQQAEFFGVVTWVVKPMKRPHWTPRGKEAPPSQKKA